MARPLRITPQLLEQAAQSPTVRAALRAKGARVLPRAQRLAAQAGAIELGKALRLTEGVRPGDKARDGFRRPYVRIAADLTDELKAADARATLSRRQILRRSAGA